MSLVHNEEADVLHVLPLLPAAGQDVPLVGGAHNDVAFAQKLQVGAGLASEQHHLLVQDVLELLVPVDEHLRNKETLQYQSLKAGKGSNASQKKHLNDFVPAQPELPWG